MLIIVPGLAVAWDIVRQADNFSLWTYVSRCLQRDILVYLYPSYWISFYFLNFLQQIFFFSLLRDWRRGRIHSKLAVVLPLKARAEVFVCPFLCAWSCCWWSHSHLQPEQCNQGTGAAALCASGQALLLICIRMEECCPQAGPPLAERDTVAAAPCGYR